MIESCSRQGDICADFFAGSGVAAKTVLDMNRNFISCDVGPLSCGKQMSGIINAGGCFELLCERANCRNNPERSFSAKINIRRNCGSMIADVEITGYTLDVDALSLNNADRAVVREACWHDLIEKWSVDFRYNGTYHNPELVFIRTGKELKFKASQKFNPNENYRINIMVNDVFGYRLFREFELSEGEK